VRSSSKHTKATIVAATRLWLSVEEREAKTVFQVAYTEFGWAVSIGGRRVAMYPWQEEALAYVEERRAKLRARGESSEVVVRGRI
jgi:hypothetical protein